MFVMLLISWGRILDEKIYGRAYKKYLPFLICTMKVELMAYPLYTSLCGSENLSQIAVLDIAGLLFGFSVYMGMLGQTENGEKINAKSLFYSALRTPAFIGTVLGIIVGLTRMSPGFWTVPFGNCYLSVENILTAAITPIILIVVGYSMEFAPELISPCLKTILLRVLLQAVMIAGVLMAVKYLIGSSRLLNGGYYIYVLACYIQYADFSEKEREQCLCIHNKFSVLCGLNPGLYHTGSGRMMELKEGIK